MKDIERRMLEVNDLTSAWIRALPIFYVRNIHNPDDKHMNIRGKFYIQKTMDDEFELFYDKQRTRSTGNYINFNIHIHCTDLEDDFVHTCYAISGVKY